jgi:hypothetical protein
MISDLFTAIILVLMAVLVMYPASRFVWQSWQDRRVRQARQQGSVRRR